MPTLGQGQLGKYVKILGYSLSGIGKTFGAGGWPRPNFMDFDGGIGTLSNPDFIKKYGRRPDIMYEVFKERSKNNRGVPTAANAFDDACRYFDACMKPSAVWTSHNGTKMEVGRDRFDTWVVDTGTSLSAAALTKAIILLSGSFQGVTSGTQSQALTHGLVFPKIQDYGSERSLVEQFIAMLYDTDKHFLFLCHEKEITDKAGDPIARVPLLTGKGVEAVSALFDEVWNIRAKKVGPDTVRYCQTRTDGVRSAKSRAGYPNEMPWEYDAILKEHEKLLALQQEKGK